MTDPIAAPVAVAKTALHARHLAAGARMIDFAGWDMPIQYRGIFAEHRAVRESVGVFDLSHMGRLYLRGPRARDLVQALATNDVMKLAPGRAQYSLFCAHDGRILDDIVVYNLDPKVLIVVNASNRQKLLAWIDEFQHSRGAITGVDLHDATEESVMIGFQGPESELILQPLVKAPLADLRYYAGVRSQAAGFDVLVARTGYTGEDGFEIVVSAEHGPALWDRLLEQREGIEPVACGLGARDTLRLEAGMALYGHEIDETTNPYEAGLGRVVKLDKTWFVSQSALQCVADRGVERKLVAFALLENGVPRQGYPILDSSGPVGVVTSGNVSPSLGTPIGMGYVPIKLSDAGTDIAVEIRGRAVAARVVRLPFYAHRTKRAGRAAS